MSSGKPIKWIGSSLKDLITFSDNAKRAAGYQLYRIQQGLEPENWKSFKSVGAGVKEIRISEDRGIFRVMYVAKFSDAVYVLHSFQKKTQKTAKKDIDIARARYAKVIEMQSGRK
ncbi:MAG: type II toxin-antitoxin system RelE/ParE family toxin [Chloroflexi bacterium]|nr:type II toxin-antitoxin system RelE/ParE family toxin [Chloroflexota bacterium]